jgi:uncharacterized protein
MSFQNRTRELATLASWWNSKNPRPGIVWGRRRAGKTALLQQFAKGKPAVFHTGARRGQVGELAQLARQVAGAGLSRPADRPYRDWDEALDDLAQHARSRRLLVVFDEFPELVVSSPELPGVLRAFLDRHRESKLRLLLCGSAVRYMEALQEQRAPLYGRFDLTLTVHPFTPAESALMLPDLAPTQRALVHGLLGGIPLYLSWWDQRASLERNLRQLVCRPAAPLLNEGQLVLATEVEQGDLPGAVLHAIASGATRHNEIKDAVRAEPTRTLDRLIELRLVERLIPVTETERSRRRIYRIADNFLAFYLGLVERFLGEIDRGLGESILPVLIESMDDHLGPVWEATFREHVRRMALTGQIGRGVVAVGPFWTEAGQSEIDALALAGRQRRVVFAGEAKWSKSVSAPRLVAELRHKLAQVPAVDGEVTLAVCARQTIDSLPEGVIGVTAADVFS